MSGMRTTSAWAFKRQLIYGSFFVGLFILLVVFIYFRYLYNPATCFDGVQNGDESAIDCGGSCVRICAFSVNEPTVKWSRSFRVTEGMYNAVAYIENSNRTASTRELNYKFALYDDQGLIAERSGSTILPPDSVYPIFEGRIETGSRIPTRTFIELEAIDLWQPSEQGREQFGVIDRTLEGADDKPRLQAVLENRSLEEAKQVEVVATIFDTNGNALTASQTYIDNFAPRSQSQVVFTWPEPIAGTLRSCEVPTDVAIAIDLSGSMNDDGGNPPQPISTVLESAGSFAARLGEQDQAAVISFATEASLVTPLSADVSNAVGAIRSMTITQAEETGSTNTGDAFLRASEELSSTRHNTNARKVMVILTDGLATAPQSEPEQYAIEKASQLKSSGVEVYAIGLGDRVNMDFIRQIATDQDHAYQALSSTEVNQIYQIITSSICEDGPAVIDIIPKTDAGFVPLGR